jgi:hypothetical protein
MTFLKSRYVEIHLYITIQAPFEFKATENPSQKTKQRNKVKHLVTMEDIGDLYVVKRTFTDTRNVGPEPTYKVAILASFTSLASAKAFARNALKEEGYDIELLPVYETNNDAATWKHGDGVLVHAEGLDGVVIEVSLDTTGNSLGLKSDSTGRVVTPLFHVLQTLIYYDEDRSGAKRASVVEGTFETRKKAANYARRVLLDADVSKSDFAEYDEYDDGTVSPFGDDVIVHAVKEGGQNILVAVVTEE